MNYKQAQRLSKCGESLYEILNVDKTATDEEIKKSYRQLALKYHSDKNPDNPEAEEMMKEINKSYNVLKTVSKKRVYDKHGSYGLYLAETYGEDNVEFYMKISSCWFQSLMTCGAIVTCWFCCNFCCCSCCCHFCCGMCKPTLSEESVQASADDDHETALVTTQPGPISSTSSDHVYTKVSTEDSPRVITGPKTTSV